jgi:hypothetical protein
MRLNRKGSMELSVNSIVILIMAITMLGIGIAFMNGMFGSLSTKLEQQFGDIPEPEAATGDKPVSLNDEFIILESGKRSGAKVSVYNPTDADWTEVSMEFECVGLTSLPTVEFMTSKIPASDSKNFIIGIDAPSVSSEEEGICALKVTGGVTVSQELTIKIKP